MLPAAGHHAVCVQLVTEAHHCWSAGAHHRDRLLHAVGALIATSHPACGAPLFCATVLGDVPSAAS